ncbi:hypothetical protein [Roseomonas sp. BN140053]|uniref:hypothetical protein n=1 Tax=Roseomonas sp. BN140053 TaxID=3391898 RepID=UPI0039EC4A75
MSDDGESSQPTSEHEPIDWESNIRRYHQLAKKTQNPMYAWLALEARFHSELGVLRENPIGEEFSIPGWVAEYLLQVLAGLMPLSAGVDLSKEPPASNHPPIDPREFANIWEMIKTPAAKRYAEAMKISYTQALTMVPAALGFTRDGGWNAFASLEATTQKMHQARFYEEAREQGIPAKVALHAIGSVIGVDDPSHMLRRIREGRKLLDDEEVAKPEG